MQKYLKELSINNFQSHVDTHFTFSPGLNIITGATENGKSVVPKAFSWLATNRPSGEEDFRNWYADKKEAVSVEAVFEKSLTLTRENGKNTYLLDGDPLKAIKTDVPSEISDFLNLSEYNIRTQFSEYFLLSDSPGERAKKLNKLVGLDIIDILYKNLDRKIRKFSTEVDFLNTSISDKKKEIVEYSYLSEAEDRVLSLEKKQSEIEGAIFSLHFIENKLDQLTQIKKDREKLSHLVKGEKEILSLSDRIAKYCSIESKLQKIDKALLSLSEVSTKIEEEKEWASLQTVSLSLLEKVNQIKEKEKQASILENILDSLKKMQVKKTLQKELFENIMIKYNNTLTEIGDVCPICGTKITKEQIKDHLSKGL